MRIASSRRRTAAVGIPVVVIAAMVAGLIAQSPGPSPILLEQRQREVLLVRHLRTHVAEPADGLALAADRRDLQRLRSAPAVPLSPLPTTASDDDLVDATRVLADLWSARLVERTPFVRMSRERLASLEHLHRALGQLQARGGRHELEEWLLEVQVEVEALRHAAGGQGPAGDAAIDVALQVADAAATGRPVPGAGPYPVVGPPGSGPYSGSGPGSTSYAPGPSGAYPPGGYPADRPLPPPPGAGSTPYTLPPAYEAYGGAAAGVGGLTACQTLRTAAGVSLAVADMIRAAECWTRTPTWPGWAAQALESLDWAVSLASIERDCAALTAAVTSLREIGPRLSAGGLATAVTALSRTAEREDRRLRGRGLCR